MPWEADVRAAEVLTHLRERPFCPIRLFLSDGKTYDVRHPEMAMVSPRQIIIGIEPSPDRMVRRFAWCDPVHVVRIERLKGESPDEPPAPS
jgi:hypothetical protein